jgi:hypothetical protein
MTQSAIASSLDAIQERLRPKLFQETVVPDSEPSGVIDLLQEILAYDADLCETAFGVFGSRLYETAKELDFDHPELKSGKFLSAVGKDASTFKKMAQFLKLCQLAKDNQLDEISPVFSKCITKAILPDVKTGLDFLKNQHQYVRLFKSAEDRLRLRKVKQVRPIEYASCLRKVVGLWDNIADLEVYGRFGNYYEEQIAQVKKRIEIYRQLRLMTMANDLIESVEEFKQGFEEAYYGFQRVPMAVAAVVLGKMHNCYLSTDQKTIMMPFSNFDGLSFETEPKTHFGSDGIGVQPKLPDYEYMPMAYPIYTSDVPEKVQEVLKHLECFPEAGGKPIFDHYIAVVPGVHYPRVLQINHQYFVYDTDGTKKFFPNLLAARIFLDAMLIRERKIIPAILGERDGKCYFICLWEQNAV